MREIDIRSNAFTYPMIDLGTATLPPTVSISILTNEYAGGSRSPTITFGATGSPHHDMEIGSK